MANTNSPAGFQVYGSTIGSDMNGKVVKCAVRAADATALFVGDAVKLDTTQDNALGLTNVAALAADGPVYGVVVGIEVDGANINTPYRLASTARTLLVNIDPNTVYVAQVDASVALADLNKNISWATGTGNTATGISGHKLTTPATTNTLGWKMLGLLQSSDNAPASAYNKVLCKINNSQIANQVAGV